MNAHEKENSVLESTNNDGCTLYVNTSTPTDYERLRYADSSFLIQWEALEESKAIMGWETRTRPSVYTS